MSAPSPIMGPGTQATYTFAQLSADFELSRSAASAGMADSMTEQAKQIGRLAQSLDAITSLAGQSRRQAGLTVNGQSLLGPDSTSSAAAGSTYQTLGVSITQPVQCFAFQQAGGSGAVTGTWLTPQQVQGLGTGTPITNYSQWNNALAVAQPKALLPHDSGPATTQCTQYVNPSTGIYTYVFTQVTNRVVPSSQLAQWSAVADVGAAKLSQQLESSSDALDGQVAAYRANLDPKNAGFARPAEAANERARQKLAEREADRPLVHKLTGD